MFPVPGWSSLSSASLKTQAFVAADQGSKTSNSVKKRRRLAGQTKREEVTSTNIADLWRLHVEGATSETKEDSESKQSKKRRRQDAQASRHREPAKVTMSESTQCRSQDRHLGQAKSSKKSSKTNVGQSEQEATPKPALGSNRSRCDFISGAPIKPSEDFSFAQTNAELTTKLTPLQASMRHKLTSARFRHLNQLLYTSSSENSLNLFAQNSEMFDEYHSGFRQQVATWPENPLDGYVKDLTQRGTTQRTRANPKMGPRQQSEEPGINTNRVEPLPRTKNTCTVADLGCGDAQLATQLMNVQKKLKLNIRSFDLHSRNPLVTKADIAQLPLRDGEVDVAILCLALMGTNWLDFVDEAWRILRFRGELWVAEIKSRFGRMTRREKGHSAVLKQGNASNGLKNGRADVDGTEEALSENNVDLDRKQETDVSAFVDVLKSRGFALQDNQPIDLSNRMFVKLKFGKSLKAVKGKNSSAHHEPAKGTRKPVNKLHGNLIDGTGPEEFCESSVLKPCVYKLR